MTVKSIFRQSDLNVMEKTVYCFGFVLLVLMFWVFFLFRFLQDFFICETYMPQKRHISRVRKFLARYCGFRDFFFFSLQNSKVKDNSTCSAKFSSNIIIHTSCLSCEVRAFVLDVSLLLMALSPDFLHLFEPTLLLPAGQFTQIVFIPQLP